MQNLRCGLLRSVVHLSFNPFVSPVTLGTYDFLKFMNVVAQVFTRGNILGARVLEGNVPGKNALPNPLERPG